MNPRLFASRVTLSPAPPKRFTYFLHGVFGSGGNLRGVAKAWLQAMRDQHGEDDHGAILVDLRMHGRSQGFAEPHTLAAAAQDVVALSRLEEAPISGLVGHSFGGKVTLAVVHALAGDVGHAALLDSMPGARKDHRGSETTMRVFDLLRALPKSFASRDAMVQLLTQQGLEKDLSSWLAMNLAPVDLAPGAPASGFSLRLDLDAIDALLRDYFVQDYWSLIETPPGRVRYNLILGGASTVYSAEDRARALNAIGARVQTHVLEGAGHFVHVDDPTGVVAALAARAHG
jgi:esterase